MTTFAEHTHAFRQQQVAQAKSKFISAAAEYATLIDDDNINSWGVAYSNLQSAEQVFGALASQKKVDPNFMDTPAFKTFYDQTGSAWYEHSKDSFIIQINDKFYRGRIGQKFEELADATNVGENLKYVCDFLRDHNSFTVAEQNTSIDDMVPQTVWVKDDDKRAYITIQFAIEGITYELYKGEAIRISK